MCGIALILTLKSATGTETVTDSCLCCNKRPGVVDLADSLVRRGPDCVACIDLSLPPNEQSAFPCPGRDVCLHFVGAELQLRGSSQVQQPFRDCCGNILLFNGEIYGGLPLTPHINDGEALLQALHRCSSSATCRRDGASTAAAAGEERGDAAAEESNLLIPKLLSRLRGEWALIYWQQEERVLWYARDVLGRRSLLIHRPTPGDPRLLLSSACPLTPFFSAPDAGATSSSASCRSPASMEGHPATGNAISVNTSVAEDGGETDGLSICPTDAVSGFEYWEDVACGIFSIRVPDLQTQTSRDGSGPQVPLETREQKHEWSEGLAGELLSWDRSYPATAPIPLERGYEQMCEQRGSCQGVVEPGLLLSSRTTLVTQVAQEATTQEAMTDGRISMEEAVASVLSALSMAVKRRVCNIQIPGRRSDEAGTLPEVGILFSGGLDSMLLAVLAAHHIPATRPIELINVSFAGESAPDRISACAGLLELQSLFPARSWRLIEVDGSLADVDAERARLLSLICPSCTHMDMNIGAALWLGARAIGKGDAAVAQAPVLLVGTGADEQCGGYARYRTKFRGGGWKALAEEMKSDMRRLWHRNLGRDDRCISDSGKEARFPFLDEDFVVTLLGLPLQMVVDLRLPAGLGDKLILRKVAERLGIKQGARQPKRAIQFGSRIAKLTNLKEFGSNRAANLASVGSTPLSNLEA